MPIACWEGAGEAAAYNAEPLSRSSPLKVSIGVMKVLRMPDWVTAMDFPRLPTRLGLLVRVVLSLMASNSSQWASIRRPEIGARVCSPYAFPLEYNCAHGRRLSSEQRCRCWVLGANIYSSSCQLQQDLGLRPWREHPTSVARGEDDPPLPDTRNGLRCLWTPTFPGCCCISPALVSTVPPRQRGDDHLWTGHTDSAAKHGRSGEPTRMARTARDPGMPPCLLLEAIGVEFDSCDAASGTCRFSLLRLLTNTSEGAARYMGMLVERVEVA